MLAGAGPSTTLTTALSGRRRSPKERLIAPSAHARPINSSTPASTSGVLGHPRPGALRCPSLTDPSCRDPVYPAVARGVVVVTSCQPASPPLDHFRFREIIAVQ